MSWVIEKYEFSCDTKVLYQKFEEKNENKKTKNLL